MKEYEVRFSVEGIGTDSSFVTVENGQLNTAAVEEQFYAFLRKNEKALIKDAADEERSNIIENLTSEQEVKLAEECMKDYHGDKDHWEDAYETFLEDLSLDQLKQILV